MRVPITFYLAECGWHTHHGEWPPDRPHESHLHMKTPGPVRYAREPECREDSLNPEGELRALLRAIHRRWAHRRQVVA